MTEDIAYNVISCVIARSATFVKAAQLHETNSEQIKQINQYKIHKQLIEIQ